MPHKNILKEVRHALSPARDETAVKASDETRPLDETRTIDGLETRRVEPTPEGEKHDHLADFEAAAEDRQEALLDEAIDETFPGSDPISPKHIT